jgi:hypothetical protein
MKKGVSYEFLFYLIDYELRVTNKLVYYTDQKEK